VLADWNGAASPSQRPVGFVVKVLASRDRTERIVRPGLDQGFELEAVGGFAAGRHSDHRQINDRYIATWNSRIFVARPCSTWSIVPLLAAHNKAPSEYNLGPNTE
jgi:hypothetical protein